MRSRNIWRILLLLGALALLAAMVPMGAAGATGTSTNGTYTLYAGQDIPIGELTVTNDTENLYVTFTMDADYCMTETHLQVGDLESVQKRGNPIPGKFEFSTEHDCVYSYTYTVPFDGLVPGDPINIAAHAKVKAPVEGCSVELWQIGDVEASAVYPEGTPKAGQELLTNYADEFNWVGHDSYAPPTPYTMGPGLAKYEPPYANTFYAGVTPDNQFPWNSNYALGYATDLDVVWNGHLHFGGTLTVSWSPGRSAAEMKVLSPGLTPASFTHQGTTITGKGYFFDTYPVYQDVAAVAPLGTGTHTINFLQTKGDGTFWDWIRLERPCETEESAWSAGTDFSGKNWATYSTYTVEEVLVDTVQVPSDGSHVTSTDLVDGGGFELRASGTYRFANWGAAGIADAQYSYRKPGQIPVGYVPDGNGFAWVNGKDLGSANYLEVWVNGGAFDWQPSDAFQPDHRYNGHLTGDGGSVDFFIPDSCGGGVLGCYGDNSGHITVDVWWVG